jgi:hypothetical protein
LSLDPSSKGLETFFSNLIYLRSSTSTGSRGFLVSVLTPKAMSFCSMMSLKLIFRLLSLVALSFFSA